MLYGYFALTGAHEESAISCLAGFIAEADDWNELDHSWSSLLGDLSSGFDATACFHGTGAFESWDIRRRHALVAGLSEVLARSALVPVGTFVVREHFSHLSSANRAILSAEGIESPLDLIFYDWTERIICRAHEQSEKISLVLCQDSQAEQYRRLFNKHLGRYLLGLHLTGDLAFARLSQSSHLQAAKLLVEAIRFVEKKNSFQLETDVSLDLQPCLEQLTKRIQQQARFDEAGLESFLAKLKAPHQQSE